MQFLSWPLMPEHEEIAQANTTVQNITIGHVFTSKTIRVTALTGCAASEIGGTTAHSEFFLPLHFVGRASVFVC
jgi:hypothetical protein